LGGVYNGALANIFAHISGKFYVHTKGPSLFSRKRMRGTVFNIPSGPNSWMTCRRDRPPPTPMRSCPTWACPPPPSDPGRLLKGVPAAAMRLFRPVSPERRSPSHRTGPPLSNSRPPAVPTTISAWRLSAACRLGWLTRTATPLAHRHSWPRRRSRESMFRKKVCCVYTFFTLFCSVFWVSYIFSILLKNMFLMWVTCF